jgi:queuine tRNA-ribosyltransferase accessory subunit
MLSRSLTHLRSSIPAHGVLGRSCVIQTLKMSTLAASRPAFEIKKSDIESNTERLGVLSFEDRHAVETPHYIAISSRGCIPHLTPDNVRTQTSIKSIYTAFEDCKFSC